MISQKAHRTCIPATFPYTIGYLLCLFISYSMVIKKTTTPSPKEPVKTSTPKKTSKKQMEAADMEITTYASTRAANEAERASVVIPTSLQSRKRADVVAEARIAKEKKAAKKAGITQSSDGDLTDLVRVETKGTRARAKVKVIEAMQSTRKK
jgi:hypothetical protein